MHFLETIEDKTDDELLNIFYNVNAWNSEMVEGVKKELTKRNILPTEIIIEKSVLEMEDNITLQIGKKAGLLGQIIGWLCVFGLLGIAIGYHYAYSKETSRYTEEVYYTYDEASRENGRYLFIMSIILSCFTLIYKLFVKSF